MKNGAYIYEGFEYGQIYLTSIPDKALSTFSLTAAQLKSVKMLPLHAGKEVDVLFNEKGGLTSLVSKEPLAQVTRDVVVTGSNRAAYTTVTEGGYSDGEPGIMPKDGRLGRALDRFFNRGISKIVTGVRLTIHVHSVKIDSPQIEQEIKTRGARYTIFNS